MEFIFTREMKTDLLDVDNIFTKSLLPWWDEISVYVPRVEDLSFKLLPAMVVNAYRYMGIERDSYLEMANLFKTIYFASKVHVLIKDDEDGQKHNQELQFTILIGDYIFGKVLSLLLKTDCDKLLDIFAVMLCDINEGLIIEHKMNGTRQEVLAKTMGPLYKNAFLTAAKVAGLIHEKALIYGEIGYNLGIALELIYIYEQKHDAHTYLDKAEMLLMQLNRNEICEIEALENLMQEIRNNLGGSVNGL